MKKRVKHMLDYELSKFDGTRINHWKTEMTDKLTWIYAMGGMNKKEYDKYLIIIENKYSEAHYRIFGY